MRFQVKINNLPFLSVVCHIIAVLLLLWQWQQFSVSILSSSVTYISYMCSLLLNTWIAHLHHLFFFILLYSLTQETYFRSTQTLKIDTCSEAFLGWYQSCVSHTSPCRSDGSSLVLSTECFKGLLNWGKYCLLSCFTKLEWERMKWSPCYFSNYELSSSCVVWHLELGWKYRAGGGCWAFFLIHGAGGSEGLGQEFSLSGRQSFTVQEGEVTGSGRQLQQ